MFIGGGNSEVLLGFQYWEEPVLGRSALVPQTPVSHARDVAVDAMVEFDITNAAGISDLVITIGGDIAYADGAMRFGWTGTVIPGSTLHAILQRQQPFARNKHVTVQATWSTGVGFYSFDTLAEEACWHGAPTSFEQLLWQPFPLRNVDLARTRILHAATTSKGIEASARAVVQMAFETEIKVVLQRLTVIANEVFTSRVCERRSFIDIDAELKPFRFIVDAALKELEENKRIPGPYLQLYERHIRGKQPRYRVCGLSALICLTAYYYVGAGAAA